MSKPSYDGLYSHARLPVRLLHDPFFQELPPAGRWLYVAIYLWLVENRKRSLAIPEQSPAILANVAGLDRRCVPSLLQKCTQLGLFQKTDDGHLTLAGIDEMAHANTKWRDGEGGQIPGKCPANPRQIPGTRTGNSSNKRELKIAEQEGAASPTPTLTQVLDLASEMNHPADDATRYFQNRDAKGWLNVADWQADFRAWAARYRPPAAPAPSANRYDPDYVDPAIVQAQQNRRDVFDAVLAAATEAGRQLTRPERLALVKNDPALSRIPADAVKSAFERLINDSAYRSLPPATGADGGPMAGVFNRLALKAGGE